MSNTDASGEKRVTGTSERREQIIQRLRQQGSVQVNDLSALYGVSTVTIRNDLAFLEKQGIAVRAYGGALICDSTTPSVEPSVEDKSALNTAMKRSVAKAAVELIQPGHRVLLDSGTTTFEIARLMRKHTDVIAMTNGMNVANALLEAEGVELLMTGGHLRRQSQSFYGDQAEQSLQNYRRMCEVAERIIVVTDSSKFNRSSLHKIIDTQRIDMIIVDEGIPADSLEGLRKAGVEVILVGELASSL
ncbi:DeoR family transcriptional regulator [Escherichia coli]|uniref:DeoR family transcriptional regulator n=1 Tax=Escherichia coli TaxID=562 RepID=UPI003EE2D5C8